MDNFDIEHERDVEIVKKIAFDACLMLDALMHPNKSRFDAKDVENLKLIAQNPIAVATLVCELGRRRSQK